MPMPPSKSWKPLLALIVLSLAWGFTWVVAKQSLAYASPWAFAAQRCAGGALALFLVLALLRRPLRMVAPGPTVIIALVNVSGFLAVQTWALVEGGAGKTAVLNYTMPVWMLMLAYPFLGERPRGAQWIAAACALGGLLLIIQPWNMDTGLVSKILGLLAAMFWAAGSILVKRLRARCDVDLVLLTAWQLLIGMVPLAAVAILVPGRPTDWSLPYIGALAFIALVSTALCWWLWVYVLDHAPAWEASLSVLGAPVVALVSSRLLLAESFRIEEILGVVLIGAGLGLLSLVSWASGRRQPPADAR